MELTAGSRRARRTKITLIATGVVLTLALGRTLIEAGSSANRPTPAGYAEAATAQHGEELRWSDLFKGKWTQGKKPEIQPTVTALVGKQVQVKGFFLPLHEAAEASEFFLARWPSGCYFCNPPGVAEVVMVSVKGGRKLSPTDIPVYAYGRLQVATGASDDPALYVIKDAEVALAR